MPNRPQTALAPAPPDSDQPTEYDRVHLVTYLKLLDADAMHVDWKVTARDVLSVDPDAGRRGARRIYAAHLARARWMAGTGYRLLLK
jgi:hypothetical protein